MEIIGKIIEALPEASGVSAAGRAWKKREYVLETQESYPKQIFFDFFGDRADLFPLQVGQYVKLTFEIESRKFNDRWFTSIRGMKAEDPNQSVGAAPAGQQPAYPGATAQPYGAAAQPYGAAAQPYGQVPGAVPPPEVIGGGGGATEDLPF